jgi:hypothetical protein
LRTLGILGTVCYDPDSSLLPANAPYGLVRRPAPLGAKPITVAIPTHRVARPVTCKKSAPKKNGAPQGPAFTRTARAYQGFRIRSSSDLPIACVRFTTFSLRRIFCTWFFTVSGLIFRIAPISKFDLPR